MSKCLDNGPLQHTRTVLPTLLSTFFMTTIDGSMHLPLGQTTVRGLGASRGRSSWPLPDFRDHHSKAPHLTKPPLSRLHSLPSPQPCPPFSCFLNTTASHNGLVGGLGFRVGKYTRLQPFWCHPRITWSSNLLVFTPRPPIPRPSCTMLHSFHPHFE